MTRTWAVALREFGSFFRTPLGWIVLALFLFLTGLVFTGESLRPGNPASLRGALSLWWMLLIVLAPAMSMRLVAEESRTGTLEPLMSAPMSEWALITGKYLGAALFLAACLAPTLLYVVLLEVLARPDYGPIVSGYLGALLLGMTYLAVGTFFSTLTSSQTLAFLLTLCLLVLLEVGARFAAVNVPAPWDSVALSMLISARLDDFAKGVIDTSHIVFFLAVSGWFLAASAVALRTRRWR